ncbi:hypothetical protein KBD18_02415 [Patescibacteria group bacterium]|nr:hypothetical protein [Patescibacteria group bacterium]
MHPLLSVGDLIDRSTQLYRTHAGMILRIIKWNILMSIALAGLDALLLHQFPDGGMVSSVIWGAALVLATVVSICTFILLVRYVVAAVTDHTHPDTLTWRAAIRNFWPVAGALLASGAVIFLGTVAFLVPGALFWVWFSFAPLLVILEQGPWLQSFPKSRALSADRFFPVLWRLAAPFFFYSILQFVLILLVPFLLQGSFLHTWSAIPLETAPLWLRFATHAISNSFREIIGPLFTISLTLLFLSLTQTPFREKETPPSV